MKTEKFVFRQAMLKDVDQMLILINRNARIGKMLPKSKKQIFDLLFNYFVAVMGDKVIGTCGCKVWADQSVEIISLATLTRFQHQGVGTRLIQSNLEKCQALGFNRFFAMTVAATVFTKLKFKRVHYSKLWFKVWVDCAACPHNLSGPGDKLCDEKAVELILG